MPRSIRGTARSAFINRARFSAARTCNLSRPLADHLHVGGEQAPSSTATRFIATNVNDKSLPGLLCAHTRPIFSFPPVSSQYVAARLWGRASRSAAGYDAEVDAKRA